MHFVDCIEIDVKAGDGGHGKVSFARAKGRPKLGPDGGDGGFGGDVVLVGNSQLNTLSALGYHRVYKAGSGDPGGVNNRNGRDGETLKIPVPVGTVVYSRETNEPVAEVLQPDEEVVLVKGGKRGIGNLRFVSSIHQAPTEFTPGGKGEALAVRLELKLIADIGFAGFPNAGKSTLLSKITNARPKIADYPFTTLIPNLGIVDFRDQGDVTGTSFIACDVPGLIEGASMGKGLGLAFLRHLERTKIIAFIIDAYAQEEGGDTPLEAYHKLYNELLAYSPALAAKPAVIILNKIDVLPPETDLEQMIEPLKKFGIEVLSISALRGDHLVRLKWRLLELVRSVNVTTQSH